MPTDVNGKGKIFLDRYERTLVITMSNTLDNIIDTESLQAIISSISSMTDDTDSIVLFGSGGRSFSVGYDGSCKRIQERGHMKNIYEMGFTISRMLASIDVPVFALVDGLTLGMGMEFALSCDMIISSRKSRFGMPDFRYGLPSLTGVISSVLETYGKRAYGMLMSGEIFDAATAFDIGVVSRIVEGKEFFRSSMEYVRSINLELMSFYKRENMRFSQSVNADRLLMDFYDLTRIRLKELEVFRSTL
ncbi:MAG: enoyl-CoA hydratase/isomerase family protein [Thermoplasmataceae archaeon]